jgi:uncharacterized phage-associated protein
MATVHNIAGFILQTGKANDDEGGYDLITNMKMQKLVYYCQGFYLAFYNTPLFPDPIEAWDHGPVCPALYRELRMHGSNPIPYDDEDYFETLNKEERDTVLLVYGYYGQFSAWRLREMTHHEPPWMNTPLSHTITHDELRNYFITRVKE